MTHKIQLTVNITSRTVLLLLVMALAIAVPFELGSETQTLTMTTTYPSPAGIYAKLISTQDTTLARDKGNLMAGGPNNTTGNFTINLPTTISGGANLIVNGNTSINGGITISSAAVQGYVLTSSDNNGTAKWQPQTSGGPKFITPVLIFGGKLTSSAYRELFKNTWSTVPQSAWLNTAIHPTAVIVQARASMSTPDGSIGYPYDSADGKAVSTLYVTNVPALDGLVALSGAAASGGDAVAWGNQVICPLDGAGNFYWSWQGRGWNGGLEIKVVGYF